MNRPLHIDHYKVLGIPRTAPPAVVKRAYREAAKRFHPDRNGSLYAADVFRAAHQAYEILSDPDRRAGYDEKLAHYRPSMQERSSPRGTRTRTFTSFTERESAPPPPWVYYGLHLTGLLFGLSLVGGILFKIVFYDTSLFALVFTLPGLAAIPDSYEGLFLNEKTGH